MSMNTTLIPHRGQSAAPRTRARQCRNCPVNFHPRPKGGSPQQFCSDTCRKEFHRNGAAFGKLRDKLAGYIEREVRKQVAVPLQEQIDELKSQMHELKFNISRSVPGADV